MASAVGMCVIAVREQVERGRPKGVQAVFAPSALDKMLKQSDFVVLAASLMAATHGLINADRLAVMKPGACLIHVGRGAQGDEAALIEALGRRRIAVRHFMCLNASHCRRNPRIRQALAISSSTVTGSCCPTICGATWSISGYPL
jgi:hypothetical protein